MAAESRGEGKEALLASTIKVVSRDGLRGLTYRAVATDAGVNNTLISYHFGSRNALLIAAMDWAVERTSTWASTATIVTGSADFSEVMVQMVFEDPDLQVFQYEMLIESRRTEELRDAVSALYSSYINAIASALRALGDDRADERARVMFATLDGLVLQGLTVTGRSEVRRSLDLARNIFLRSIEK